MNFGKQTNYSNDAFKAMWKSSMLAESLSSISIMGEGFCPLLPSIIMFSISDAVCELFNHRGPTVWIPLEPSLIVSNLKKKDIFTHLIEILLQNSNFWILKSLCYSWIKFLLRFLLFFSIEDRSLRVKTFFSISLCKCDISNDPVSHVLS